MDNPEGIIDIELERLYDINLTEDKNKLDIMDMNMDLLTKMFEQTRVTGDINDNDGRDVDDDAEAIWEIHQDNNVSTVTEDNNTH